MKYLVIGLGLMTQFTIAHAASLNIRVADETVALALQSSNPDTGAAVEAGFVRNRDDDTTVVNAGLFVSGTGERSGLVGRMGVKAYAADLNNQDGYGLALGGDVAYPFGAGISINGGLYFGPNELAFNDVDRYREWYLSASYEVFDNAKLAAGLGTLEIEPRSRNEIEISDGFFLEMNLSF